MKNLMKYIPAVLFFALTVVLASCGGGDDGDGGTGELDLDAIATDLGATWTYSDRTFPSGASNADDISWTDLTLTFTGTAAGGTYTTSGHPANNNAEALAVWPASGNWTFSDKTSTTTTILDRSDDVEVTVSSLTESTLVVSFDIPEESNVRAGEIDGGWTFTFTK